MSNLRLKSLRIAVLLLAITILLAAVMSAGGSAGGTLSSGRSVITHSDSVWLSSIFSADTATIQTAGKTIVVQPTSLVVDGVTVANIDKEVADVQVRVQRGVVTFVADGTPVQTSLR